MSTWMLRNDGPTPGLRVAVKDLIDVAGWPTTAGSRAVARHAVAAATDAACLAGLRAAVAAGTASIVGKTNLHELAFGITGVNAWSGTPVNPLDPRRVPGGSSSGAAVAVAVGEADVAYGSDTGGSVRIPAACCGVTGLKTTWGRVPLDGVWPLAPSLDTIGPMARDVAGVVAGMALLEPGFAVAAESPRRIGRVDIGAEADIDAAVDRALAAAGIEVVALHLDGLAGAQAAAQAILDTEAWAVDAALVASDADGIGDDVLARLRAASRVEPAALAVARVEAATWRATLDAAFEKVDVLAVPTLLGPPPLLEDAASMWRIRGLTSPVNLAGLPALAVPVPGPGPLPASVQLIGPRHSEERLLRLGTIVEAAVAR
jgi:amidase